MTFLKLFSRILEETNYVSLVLSLLFSLFCIYLEFFMNRYELGILCHHILLKRLRLSNLRPSANCLSWQYKYSNHIYHELNQQTLNSF
jgi:hypothetical protein